MLDKVGVLTFHRCINYGSYWQARCLAEGLSGSGAKAVLLEHQSRSVNRAEWRCALQPLLPIATTKDDHPLYRRKIRKFLEAFDTLPLSAPFQLHNPAGLEGFGLVIVGSDEVWNLKHPWYGGCSLFFGEGLLPARLASYAASFGNLGSAERLHGRWAEKLRNFSHISVRDMNSRRLISETLGYSPEIVLDPCLQFSQVITRAAAGNGSRPYVAVYGHSFPAWFKRTIRRWANRREFALLSIGYRNDWADEHWIDAGPEDFARVVAGAKAVATNFFHGCVFSLVNEKPFACVLSDYRSNKLRDLVMTVGADRYLLAEISPDCHVDTVLTEPLPQEIPDRIAALRRRSSAYLDHVLH